MKQITEVVIAVYLIYLGVPVKLIVLAGPKCQSAPWTILTNKQV